MTALLDLHSQGLTSFSFSPVEEMGFYHRETKFKEDVLYLDIHTKTTKQLQKKNY